MTHNSLNQDQTFDLWPCGRKNYSLIDRRKTTPVLFAAPLQQNMRQHFEFLLTWLTDSFIKLTDLSGYLSNTNMLD